jgi:hypothetical protein
VRFAFIPPDLLNCVPSILTDVPSSITVWLYNAEVMDAGDADGR